MQAAIGQQELQHPRQFPTSTTYEASRTSASGSYVVEGVGSISYFIDFTNQQISGSLQSLRTEKPPALFPYHDPYISSLEPQGSVLIPLISFTSSEANVPRRPDIANEIDAFLATVPAPPKVVASFGGRVESLSGAFANVLLINERTGERMESRCDAELLHENGISVGDDFRFEIVRRKGTTATRFSRLPPKHLPKERLDQIRSSFKDRWTF